MRVAAVQVASTIDSTANRDLVEARLAAMPADLDLVVLPEATMHVFGPADHKAGNQDSLKT